MARDISQIKKLALQREETETPESRLIAKPQKTITSIKNQEIRQDPGTQIVLDKVRASKNLSKAIEKKRVELESIAGAAKSILAGANEEADRIVIETKKQASAIISQAKSDATSAKNLLETNKTKELELQKLDEKISQREKDLLEKEQKVGQTEKVVNKDKENVDKLLATASEREKAAVEIFANSLSLFELVFEQAKQLQDLSSGNQLDLSQTLSKTDTMIQRIALLLEQVDAGNSANVAKAQELQKWQEGLVDREQTLDRSAKEIQKMKGQQHGK